MRRAISKPKTHEAIQYTGTEDSAAAVLAAFPEVRPYVDLYGAGSRHGYGVLTAWTPPGWTQIYPGDWLLRECKETPAPVFVVRENDFAANFDLVPEGE